MKARFTFLTKAIVVMALLLLLSSVLSKPIAAERVAKGANQFPVEKMAMNIVEPYPMIDGNVQEKYFGFGSGYGSSGGIVVPGLSNFFKNSDFSAASLPLPPISFGMSDSLPLRPISFDGGDSLPLPQISFVASGSNVLPPISFHPVMSSLPLSFVSFESMEQSGGFSSFLLDQLSFLPRSSGFQSSRDDGFEPILSNGFSQSKLPNFLSSIGLFSGSGSFSFSGDLNPFEGSGSGSFFSATGRPTFSPTFAPTLFPTVSPTVAPSETPTVAPSETPTVAPSETPTVAPTLAPTFTPTLSPTTVSTSATPAPTLDISSQWNGAMNYALQQLTVNDPESIVFRSTYFELIIADISDNYVFGGCNSYQSITNSELSTASLLYIPSQIDLTAQETVDPTGRLERPETLSCSEDSAVSSIVDFFLDSTQTVLSVTCSDRSWNLERCSSNNIPAVCVDCSDPCGTTNFCEASNPYSSSGSTYSYNTDSPFTVAPCVNKACDAASGSPVTSGLRILSFAFENLENPPSIVSTTTEVTKSSISITAELSSPGTLYCASYSSSASAPSSTGSIQQQNFVSATNAFNQSEILIDGLSAATDYSVYCMTVSPLGVEMSLTNALATLQIITTECCKVIEVSTVATFINENSNVLDFFTIVVASRPAEEIEMTLSVLDSTGTVISPSPLFPSVFTVQALSGSTSGVALTSAISALSAGEYSFELDVTGSSAAQYEVSYANSVNTVDVLSADAIPPAPSLSSALFSDDGAYVKISFNGETNRGGVATVFTCSSLFSFDCAETSSCRWFSNRMVYAFISASSSCASIGSTVTLTSTARVVAKCQRADGSCDTTNWPSASSSVALTIAAPTTAISPSVAVAAPGSIGLCDSLTLDVTSSSGNGGRPWSSRSITVQTTATKNVTDLQKFLDQVYVISPPTAIEKELLSPGFSYNFVVKLCNFLGKCSQASKRVAVLSIVVPTVTIPGNPFKTTKRSDTFNMVSNSFIRQCDGTSSTVGLAYSWEISLNGAIDLSLVSSSKDPAALKLLPYSLAVGNTYTAKLTATIIASSLSSSTSVNILVLSGNVVPIVNGGAAVKNVRVDESFQLDGSKSYDEDIAGLTGTNAGLVYSWSCKQLSPTLTSDCSAALTFDSSYSASAEFFAASARSDASGAVLQVTLVLSDTAGSRTASKSVVLNILQSLTPVVSLVSNLGSSQIINPGKALSLTAAVDFPTNNAGKITWSVDDTSAFSLESSTTSAISRQFQALTTAGQQEIYLVIQANTLPAGTSLTFSLLAEINGGPGRGNSGSSSITININDSPRPGTYLVSPTEGTELSDVFQFSADQWYDENLPLVYAFGYYSNTGTKKEMRSRAAAAFMSSQLTAGLEDENFVVETFVVVYDALNASSTELFDVTVNAGEQFNASEAAAFAASTLSSSGGVDGLKQGGAFASAVANKKSCKNAPDCAALNRNPCAAKANTCGSCLSNYIGAEGDSNELCVLSTALSRRRLMNATCESKSDCGSFQDCVNATCVDVLKSCPEDCSSRGECSYEKSETGIEITTCYVGDPFCDAVCTCDEGYVGRACSYTELELEQKQETRRTILQGFQRLLALEDVDEEVITGWMATLVESLSDSDEVAEDVADLALDIINTIISNSIDLGISPATAAGLLSSIDTVASSSTNEVRRRRRLLRRNLRNNSKDAIRELQQSAPNNRTLRRTDAALQSYTSLILAGLFPGEDAVETTQSQFRSFVQLLSIDTSGNSSYLTVSLPKSTLENAQGSSVSQIRFPIDIEANSNVTSLSVSLSTLKSTLYNDVLGEDDEISKFQSSPLSFDLSEALCGQSAACTFEAVLQIASSIDPTETSEMDEFTSYCSRGSTEVFYHTCPDNSTISIDCATDMTSGKSGNVTAYCPVSGYEPLCNGLSGLSVSEEVCTVSAFTATNVTCLCSLSSSVRRNRRQLQATDDGNEDSSVDYVVMLKGTQTEFVSTINTADNLSFTDLKNGWVAFLVVGLILIGFTLFGYLGYREDLKATQISPTETQSGISAAKSEHWKRYPELRLIDEALPEIMSSASIMSKLREEIRTRHRWFGIIYLYSREFPRVLRVASLATNLILMMFIQALTYSLTNPSPKECESLTTKEDCLSPDSPYGADETKCSWDEGSQECNMRAADTQVEVVIFVAIFSAIISTPLALFVDWLAMNVICAPLKSSEYYFSFLRNKDAVSKDTLPRDRSFVADAAEEEVIVRSSVEKKGHLEEEARSQLKELTEQVRAYRSRLPQAEHREFDFIWGLEPDGSFKKDSNTTEMWKRMKAFCSRKAFDAAKLQGVERRLFNDLVDVEISTFMEKAHIDRKLITEAQSAQRLFYLFQKDLLPGISGQVLEFKSKRDVPLERHVYMESKITAWAFVIALNLGMLFYIVLFAVSRPVQEQNAFALSFMVEVLLEVLLICTVAAIVTHVLIPSMIMRDVHATKKRLLQSIRSYENRLRQNLLQQPEMVDFDASEFLFVSKRVAKLQPHLKEAQIISNFHTPWPKHSYKHESDVSKEYGGFGKALGQSLMFFATFFILSIVNLPPVLQDILIQSGLAAVFGYILLLHVQLWRIFPVLAFIPLIVLILLVVAAVQYLQYRHRIRHDEFDKYAAGGLEGVPGIQDGDSDGVGDSAGILVDVPNDNSNYAMGADEIYPPAYPVQDENFSTMNPLEDSRSALAAMEKENSYDQEQRQNKGYGSKNLDTPSKKDEEEEEPYEPAGTYYDESNMADNKNNAYAEPPLPPPEYSGEMLAPEESHNLGADDEVA